ncbi:hypothetical protein [Arcanobacterium hippocoleae]|uniref:hypothetical protein n=1 Tax=Arcanobacterium hippocoleae TaxID=149017 RepID=UPI00333EFAAA
MKEVQKYDDTRDIQYFTDSVQTQEKSAITDQQLGAQAHAVRTRIDLSSLAQSAKKKRLC